MATSIKMNVQNTAQRTWSRVDGYLNSFREVRGAKTRIFIFLREHPILHKGIKQCSQVALAFLVVSFVRVPSFKLCVRFFRDAVICAIAHSLIEWVPASKVDWCKRKFTELTGANKEEKEIFVKATFVFLQIIAARLILSQIVPIAGPGKSVCFRAARDALVCALVLEFFKKERAAAAAAAAAAGPAAADGMHYSDGGWSAFRAPSAAGPAAADGMHYSDGGWSAFRAPSAAGGGGGGGSFYADGWDGSCGSPEFGAPSAATRRK